mmetsp:Transcript_76920/g.223355  ORF Transcript_76920/g.223355 Transcript_76920/m.223355 type:complete len:463 (+) Transcript_76920:602-1990(+)
MLPGAITPVPEEPAMRRLPVRLQLRGREHALGLIGLGVAVAREVRGQRQAPLADDGRHTAQNFPVALGHSQVVRKSLPPPPIAKNMVQVQVEGNVRELRKAIVLAAPNSPDLVEPLRAVHGEHDTDLVWAHASPSNRPDGALVELAKDFRGDRLAGLVAHRDTSDGRVAAVSLRQHTQSFKRVVESPIIPTPVLPFPATWLFATFPTGRSVQVEQDLEPIGIAPSEDAIQVLEARSHELVLVRRAHDHPIAEGNSDGVEAHLLNSPDVVLYDEGFAVCLEHLRCLVNAQGLPHPPHQGPLARGAFELIEQRSTRPRLKQQPTAQVDTSPGRSMPVQRPLVLQEAVRKSGCLAQVQGNLAPEAHGAEGHRPHASGELRRGDLVGVGDLRQGDGQRASSMRQRSLTGRCVGLVLLGLGGLASRRKDQVGLVSSVALFSTFRRREAAGGRGLRQLDRGVLGVRCG